MNFKDLKTGTKSEQMLSKACVLLTGSLGTEELSLSPQDVLTLLDDLVSGNTNASLNETIGQTIFKLNLGTPRHKHEK
jgi:hypothetical protein